MDTTVIFELGVCDYVDISAGLFPFLSNRTNTTEKYDVTTAHSVWLLTYLKWLSAMARTYLCMVIKHLKKEGEVAPQIYPILLNSVLWEMTSFLSQNIKNSPQIIKELA